MARKKTSPARKPAATPPPKKGMGVFGAMLMVALVLGVLAGGVGLGGLHLLTQEFSKAGPHDEDVTLQLERGSGLIVIASRLQSAGVVRDGRVFRAGVTLRGGERALKAGEYVVPAGASMAEIYDILLEGDVVAHALTFAEGLTSYQIVEILNASDVLTGEIDAVPPEGVLLPETYQITRGDTRQSVLNRMAEAQDALLDALWDAGADDLPYQSRDEAVIAASIVEKETGRADERARVAAVVRNRLARPMRLQMDSTIIYGAWLQDRSRPLNVEPLGPELDRSDNPYNTYTHDGLPPGPISNPGRDALAATLNPEPTPDGARPILYFVASCEGDGLHHFSATLRQHEAYRAEWRRCRRALRQAANQ